MPTIRSLRLAGSFAAFTLAAVLAPRAGQAQTITACSATKSGSMYRVGVDGTPATCTNTAHRKESWNVQGPPGLSGYVIVQKASTSAPPGGGAMLILSCPVGKKVLSGGFSGATFDVNTSMPSSEDKWIFTGKNLGSTSGTFTGYAVCATVAP